MPARAHSGPRSRALRALCFLAMGAAAGLAARGAQAFCRTTTQFRQTDPTMCPDPPMGVPLAWTSDCASSSVNPTLLPPGITRDQFRDEVTAAFTRWSTATCAGGGSPTFHFVAYPDVPHAAQWNPHGTNANTVSFLETWGNDAYHPPEAIAITITTFDAMTGEIRDADTELNLLTANNPDGFNFTVGAPNADSADLPTILTHELGHAQGLAHPSQQTSVMWYRAGLGEQRRTPTDDDVAGICAIYPPDRVATCMPDPPGGFQGGSGCGCRAAGHSGGAAPTAGALLVLVGLAARRRRR